MARDLLSSEDRSVSILYNANLQVLSTLYMYMYMYIQCTCTMYVYMYMYVCVYQYV